MTVLSWLVVTAIATLIGAELLAWSAPLHRALLRGAARALPHAHRERYLEEWHAELEQQPDGPITRLVFAASLFMTRGQLARELATHSSQAGATAWAKRIQDLCLAALALVVLAPSLVVIAAAIRVTSPGPALYRQVRVGRDGLFFTMWKFRTMYVDADLRRAEWLDAVNGAGPVFKIRQDPRITPLGRFLRKHSLDELPQLLNVLRGDMSLVGPRPSLPEEVVAYDEAARRRLRVMPGLTGLWQVSGRASMSWHEAILMDLEYVKRWSLWLDLKILLRTFVSTFRRY